MQDNSSSGTCAACGAGRGKYDMLDHLQHCEETTARRSDRQATAYQLRIEDRYGGLYWLDVEMAGDAPLAALDQFLRRSWLECCEGHIRAFEIGATHYVAPFNERLAVLPSETDMNVSISRALSEGKWRFSYDYDFDQPTHLIGRVVSMRKGSPPRQPVRLLARNNPIERVCSDCGAPAVRICSYPHANPFLCDAHAETHACGKYALLPVVNSPRTGVCAYEGGSTRWRKAV